MTTPHHAGSDSDRLSFAVVSDPHPVHAKDTASLTLIATAATAPMTCTQLQVVYGTGGAAPDLAKSAAARASVTLNWTATGSTATDPARRVWTLTPPSNTTVLDAESLCLTLSDIPVSDVAGPARIWIHETGQGQGDTTTRTRTTWIDLTKHPAVPAPDSSRSTIVGVWPDAGNVANGEKTKVRWKGRQQNVEYTLHSLTQTTYAKEAEGTMTDAEVTVKGSTAYRLSGRDNASGLTYHAETVVVSPDVDLRARHLSARGRVEALTTAPSGNGWWELEQDSGSDKHWNHTFRAWDTDSLVHVVIADANVKGEAFFVELQVSLDGASCATRMITYGSAVRNVEVIMPVAAKRQCAYQVTYRHATLKVRHLHVPIGTYTA
jgi:hypothetical protein